MYAPKRALVVALITVGLVPAAPTAQAVARRQAAPCIRRFTIAMFDQAADTAYAGTRTPTSRDLAALKRFGRCNAHPWEPAIEQRLLRADVAAWKVRRNPPGPTGYILASWYNDAGQTASGMHFADGFASCGATGELCLSWGTPVRFYYGGRSVIAYAQDHGPYAGSRGVDLNQGTAAALGFDGVGTVGYRIGG